MRSIWLGVASALITMTGILRGLRLRLQLLEHFAAVNVGKVEIEQDELRVLCARHLEGFLARLGPDQIGPGTVHEDVFDQAEVGFAVFDVKDARMAVGAGARFADSAREASGL